MNFMKWAICLMIAIVFMATSVNAGTVASQPAAAASEKVFSPPLPSVRKGQGCVVQTITTAEGKTIHRRLNCCPKCERGCKSCC